MIFIACDHAGFALKQKLTKWFEKCGTKFVDCGAYVFDANDSYVDVAKSALQKFEQNLEQNFDQTDRLVLICGSGVGMSIVANRSVKVRAVLALSAKQVKQARAHNNANCLCLGARNTCFLRAKQFIRHFLATDFVGGKHLDRINSI